jgi:predicted permease
MGSLAYPFIEVAYGSKGLAALAIFETGNALVIVVFAYYLSHRYSSGRSINGLGIAKRVVTSIPFLAVCGGLLLNAGQIPLSGLPGDLVAELASVNSPLMLLSLGVYLEVDLCRSEGKVLLVYAMYKYGIGLLIGLFCFFALPYRGALRAVAFLLPLMPTSMSTLVYSTEQDLNPRLAAMLTSLSMLISLTITTVVLIGFRSLF